MASVPVAGAVVAVASSVTLRRMYERKEDMLPAVGGAVVIGTVSVSTSMSMPAVEVAAAVVPAAVSTVASREGGAAEIVPVEVTGTAASPATSEGTIGKWGDELPRVPASR